jgi:hypothetical protein
MNWNERKHLKIDQPYQAVINLHRRNGNRSYDIVVSLFVFINDKKHYVPYKPINARLFVGKSGYEIHNELTTMNIRNRRKVFQRILHCCDSLKVIFPHPRNKDPHGGFTESTTDVVIVKNLEVE